MKTKLNLMLLCIGMVLGAMCFVSCIDDPEEPELIERPSQQLVVNNNGYEFVDLGLPSGVLWATCNIGAKSPEEYGFLYAWGELKTKSKCTLENSKWDGVTSAELMSQGVIDSKGNLTPTNDVARLILLGDWRTPTYAELNELCKNTKTNKTTLNGVRVMRFLADNGNMIYLPMAGVVNESGKELVGESGCYWSSTVGPDKFGAGAMTYNFLNEGTLSTKNGFYRYVGMSIRPVISPKK